MNIAHDSLGYQQFSDFPEVDPVTDPFLDASLYSEETSEDVVLTQQYEQHAEDERNPPIGDIVVEEPKEIEPEVPQSSVGELAVEQTIDSESDQSIDENDPPPLPEWTSWEDPVDTQRIADEELSTSQLPEHDDKVVATDGSKDELARQPEGDDADQSTESNEGLSKPPDAATGNDGSDGPGDNQPPSRPAEDEPNDEDDTGAQPAIDAIVEEIVPLPEVIPADGATDVADVPGMRFDHPPDDDRAITDDSLIIGGQTLEEMMSEMDKSQLVPTDFPIGHVGFMDVEPPEFGNSNEPSNATRRFADLIRGIGKSQLVLCEEQYACMADSDSPSAEFTQIPAFAEGRKQSRHGVMFGKLVIETNENPPITTFVAMKPYDRRGKDTNFGARPDRAVAHDWATNQHLRRLSTSGAYEPIGIWRAESDYPVPGLITRFNERSLSLDNLLRTVVVDTDSQPDIPVTLLRARQALHLGHFGLGVAHGIGVTHGDAAPQNFATDGSHIIFNDTTTIQPFASTQRRNEVRAEHDMSDFVSGAIHPDVTTEEMRSLTGGALKERDFRTGLYHSYLAGAALGAQRAGYAKSGGVLVPESVHDQIVDRFIQKYVPAKEGI